VANNNKTDGAAVLADIPVHLDVPMVLASIKSSGANKRLESIIRELIEIVLPVVRPKILYKVSRVTLADGRHLEVDGCRFTHHVPSLSFQMGERVFPYIATCGREIEVVQFPGDLMKEYCMNMIKNTVLMQSTVKYFEDYLKTTFLLPEVSRIGPGEAMGNTTQQRTLFSLLGDVEGTIGVRLSDHHMMVPEKSSSGIYFETAVRIESCQLCPNDCPSRRAPYDPELFKTYRKKS
jgi:hypothetical protein